MVPEPQSVNVDTSYVVLYTTELDPKWGEYKRVTARSAEAAIKSAIGEKIPDGAVQFVAVPERSWKPVKVRAKIETTLVLEGLS